MQDHANHVKDVQEGYSQLHTPLVLETDGIAGPSSGKGKGKSGEDNLPPSSSADDDESRVNSDLLNAWMQRLQVLTVVTAFLASMDVQLFALTAVNTQIGQAMSRTARELTYACLAGALIFHICATILAYTASFALIRYRTVDALGEDGTKVGGILLFSFGAAQPTQRLSRRIVLEPVRPLHWLASFLERPEFRLISLARLSSRWSSPPPLSLLTRCYYTSLCFTAVGFILGLVGVLTYVWAGLRIPVGIFSTICLGVCISVGVWAIAV